MITNKTLGIYSVSLVALGVLFGSGGAMMAIPYAFAEQCENPSDVGCSNFSWESVIGDILLGVALVTVLLYLIRVINKKHIDIMSLVRVSLGDTKDILLEEKKMRDRLKQYAKQAFNNDCGALLLCFGMLHKFSESGNDDWTQNPDVDRMLGKSRKIFVRIRNTINLSIGTIDPVLLEEIEKFLIDSEDLVEDINQISTKYSELKKKIMYLADRLNTDNGEMV